jgi:eukaryotic-like serine/threonine-protein kinase
MADSGQTVRHFGRFEVLDEIGRGAMGVVYRARDPRINRIVAIKTVSLGGQPPDVQNEYRERFRREAKPPGGFPILVS